MDKFTVCLRVFVEIPVQAETPEEAVEIAWGTPISGHMNIRGNPVTWYTDRDELRDVEVFDENGNEITLKENSNGSARNDQHTIL